MPKQKFSIFNFQFSIVLIIGLILRLININQSLWLDEAISFEASSKYSLVNLFTHFLPNDFNPPLYYLILHFWLRLFPSSEFFLRLPSVVFGLLTCVFVYKLYRLIFKDKMGALLSLILMATAPLHLYYSQEARPYSLAALTTSASIYYFIRFLRSKNRLFTIHYSLFTILMLYSHYLCWLILPTQWLYFLIQKNKNKKLTLNFLISNFLMVLLSLPWLPTFLKQLNIGQKVGTGSDWGRVLGETNLKNVLLLPVKFIIGRTAFDHKLLYYFIVSLLILFFGFLLWQALKMLKKSLFHVRLEYSAPGAEGAEGLFWLWLIVPPFLGMIISLKIPVFSYFRFLFCLPAFYLLIARGVLGFKNPKKFIFLILFINLFFSSRYLFNQNYHRENWQEAVRVLEEKNINQAPVLILENVSAPFNFYDKQASKIVFFAEKELIADEEAVWLIPYAQPIFDPQDTTRKFLENKGFIRVFEEHFRGVTLEKWQKLMAIKL